MRGRSGEAENSEGSRESKSKGVRVTDRGSKSAIRRVTNTTDPLQTNSRVLARLLSGTERVYWSSRRRETRFSSPQPFLLDSPVNLRWWPTWPPLLSPVPPATTTIITSTTVTTTTIITITTTATHYCRRRRRRRHCTHWIHVEYR